MAKGYHVLAGLCRDLRNALDDDANGSAEAEKLVDNFNEILDILDERSDGMLPDGQEGDDSASGNDAESENTSMDDVPRETGDVRGVGSRGRSPAIHSTRARQKLESSRRPQREQMLLPTGVRNARKI